MRLTCPGWWRMVLAMAQTGRRPRMCGTGWRRRGCSRDEEMTAGRGGRVAAPRRAPTGLLLPTSPARASRDGRSGLQWPEDGRTAPNPAPRRAVHARSARTTCRISRLQHPVRGVYVWTWEQRRREAEVWVADPDEDHQDAGRRIRGASGGQGAGGDAGRLLAEGCEASAGARMGASCAQFGLGQVQPVRAEQLNGLNELAGSHRDRLVGVGGTNEG